jgi:hypothetical protein
MQQNTFLTAEEAYRIQHISGYSPHTSRIQVPFSLFHGWILGCQPLIWPAEALSREHDSGVKTFELFRYAVRP